MRTGESKRRTVKRARPVPRSSGAEQGDGVLDAVYDTVTAPAKALFGPSAEAQARVDELRARWDRLQAWGVRRKLPSTRRQQEALVTFLEQWQDHPDESNINPVTADLVAIERSAQEYDQKRGGTFKATPISTKFEIEQASTAIKAAAITDKAAHEVTEVVKEAGKDAAALVQHGARELGKATGISLPVAIGLGLGLAGFVGLLAYKVMVPAQAR